MADYPASIPDLTTGVPSDGDAEVTSLGDDSYPHDDHHRDLGQEVEAIATELGTSPSGASVDVAARFAAVESVADAAQTAGEVAAAVAAHEADTSVHGIADTTVLATDAEVAAAVAVEAALARNADNLTSGTVADARIASTIARDSEVTAAISAHEAASDPHTGYLTAAEGNAAYQPLDSDLTAVAGLTAPATQITDSTAHISDSTAAHAASAIAFTPDGSIAATNVQDAIEEVRDEAGSVLAIGAAVSGQTDNTVLFTDASGNLDDGVLTIEQSTLFGLADYTRVTAPVASAGGPGWANASALGAPFDVSGWFLDPFDLFAVTNLANIKSAFAILNDTPGTILTAGHFGIGLGGSNPASPGTSAIHLDVTQSDGSTDVTFGSDIDVLDFGANVLKNLGAPVDDDDAATKEYVDTEVAGAGGGSPGGSDTYVQYNDGGAFGGEAAFAYDETNNRLTVTGGYRMDSGSGSTIGDSGGSGHIYFDANAAHVYGYATVNLRDASGEFAVLRRSGAQWINTAIDTAPLGGGSADYGMVFSGGTVSTYDTKVFVNYFGGKGAAAANGDDLYGVVFRPQFTPGAYTGLTQIGVIAVTPNANSIGFRLKATAAQAVDMLQVVDSSDALMFAVAKNGAVTPASLADSAAANGTIYYSTDAGKLVYKDSGGSVNALY